MVNELSALQNVKPDLVLPVPLLAWCVSLLIMCAHILQDESIQLPDGEWVCGQCCMLCESVPLSLYTLTAFQVELGVLIASSI